MGMRNLTWFTWALLLTLLSLDVINNTGDDDVSDEDTDDKENEELDSLGPCNQPHWAGLWLSMQVGVDDNVMGDDDDDDSNSDEELDLLHMGSASKIVELPVELP